MAGTNLHLDRVVAKRDNKKMEWFYQNSERLVFIAEASEQTTNQRLG